MIRCTSRFTLGKAHGQGRGTFPKCGLGTRLPPHSRPPYFGNAPHPGVLPYTKIPKHEMWNVTNHPDKANLSFGRHWHQASQVVVSFVSFFGDPRDR